MAAYHIGGNTIHNALNVNGSNLTPLTSDVLNSLWVKHMNLKVVFIDEISVVGYELFKKLEQRLCEIMGSPKPFGNLYIIAVGDFYHLAPVQDTLLYLRVHPDRNPPDIRCIKFFIGETNEPEGCIH